MYPYNLGFEDIENFDLNQLKFSSAAKTNVINSKEPETVPVSAMSFSAKYKVPTDLGMLPSNLKKPTTNADILTNKIKELPKITNLPDENGLPKIPEVPSVNETDLKFYKTDFDAVNPPAAKAIESKAEIMPVDNIGYKKNNFKFKPDNNYAQKGGDAYKPVFPGTQNPFGPGGSFPNPNFDQPEFIEPDNDGPLFGGGYSKPSSPPPTRIPQKSSKSILRIDSGSIRGCLFHYTYVWLKNGFDFWFYPVYIGKNSISGFRWMKYGWAYTGVDLSWIDFFQCV